MAENVPATALNMRAFRARASAAGYRRVRFPIGPETARRITALREASGLTLVRVVDDLLLHPDASRILRETLADRPRSRC